MKDKTNSSNPQARESQSADFEAKKSVLKKRRDDILADIQKNTRLRNYVASQKNEEFELKGQDRAAILADYDTKVRVLNRQLQGVKSAIDTCHLERKNDIEAEKARISSHHYSDVRQPRERKLANIQAQLESLFSELLVVIIGTPDDSFQAEDVRENDADIEDLNKSGVEFGVPSNFFRIAEAEKLSKARAALAEESVRKLLSKIKQMTDDFHRQVEGDWKRKNPEQARLLAEGQRR